MNNSNNVPIQFQPTVRILIVDDLARVRSDLRQLLELTGGIEVAGEAANGIEAVAAAGALHPDVVLMDLEMPGMDGCEAARQIKALGLAKKVILFSIHADPEIIQRALNAGADTYLQKGEPFETLLAAIMMK